MVVDMTTWLEQADALAQKLATSGDVSLDVAYLAARVANALVQTKLLLHDIAKDVDEIGEWLELWPAMDDEIQVDYDALYEVVTRGCDF